MTETTTSRRGAAGPAVFLENARRLLQMRIDLCDGRGLSGDALREMSDFRRSIMSMKPEVDLDADYAHFAGLIVRCPIVVRARDRDGVLRGTFVLRWVDGGRGSQKWRLVLPEYGFFHPSLRGSPVVPWAVFRALSSRLDLMVGREVFVGNVAYPVSALAFERVFGPARFLSDSDLDGPTREVLDWIVADLAAPRFDVVKGRVWMPTRPPRPSTRWYQRMASQPTFARYVARCPDWLDGYALPMVCRFKVRDLPGAVGRLLTRSLLARWESGPAATSSGPEPG